PFAMLKDFRKALAQEILLADGAMGTLLVSRGASPDQAKSPLNLTDPESVREVHDDYSDAGARILTTNTWDANRVKLTAHEWSGSLEKINREGVRIARESASGDLAFIAGSVGPLGALVKPYGSLTLVQVREIFQEQIRALLEGGVDLLLLETFGSLLEAAEAVRAARGLSAEIPIVAGMTFLSDGRTAFGESAPHALSTLALAGREPPGRTWRRRRHGGDRGRARGAGLPRGRGQRHRQPDGAPAHVVDRGRRARAARDRTGSRGPDHHARQERPGTPVRSAGGRGPGVESDSLPGR